MYSYGEYQGVFKKTNVSTVITDIDQLSENTKEFESEDGSTYYNIRTMGASPAGVSTVTTGKINTTLTVTENTSISNMLKTFDSAEETNAVTCYRYNIENFSGNHVSNLVDCVNHDH